MNHSVEFLRTLVEVCEHKSFTKAAEKLHKAQSTLSAQITALEEVAGLTLLDRSQRPFRITEAGVVFLQFATQIVNQTDQLNRAVKELAGGTAGEVRIATTTSLAAYMLPQMLSRFMQTAPAVRFNIDIQPLALVRDSVRQADSDFGIILSEEKRKQFQGLAAKVLKKERLCFVVSPRHQLATRTKVFLRDLGPFPFVMGAKAGEYSTMIDRMLERKGFSNYEISLRIASFQAIKESVRFGLGIGVLPEFMVQRELRGGALCELTVRDTLLTCDILLIERPKYIASPTVTTVKSFLATSSIP